MSQAPLDYIETEEVPDSLVQQSGHPRGTWLLAGSRLFERMSHYGVRGLFIAYLVESLQMNRPETAGKYGLFLSLGYLFMIPGGILGDFLFGARLGMLIGSSCQILGCLILATLPDSTLFYGGMGLFVFGSGLYGPNFLCQFAGNYKSRLKLFDSGAYILYFALNLGAIAAPLMSVLLDKDSHYNFRPLFLAYAGTALISLLLNLFHKGKILPKPKTTMYSITGSKANWLIIGAVLILVPIFWGMFEASHNIISSTTSIQASLAFSSLNMVLLLSGCIVCAIVFAFARSSAMLRIGIGLIVLALLMLTFLLPANVITEKSAMNSIVPFILMGILTISELLVTPGMILLVGKYLPEKLLGTGSAIFLAVSFLSYKLALLTGDLIRDQGMLLIVSCACGLLFLFSMLFFFFRKKQM
jgi:POT family proton-dependent oligopeptide transporter